MVIMVIQTLAVRCIQGHRLQVGLHGSSTAAQHLQGFNLIRWQGLYHKVLARNSVAWSCKKEPEARASRTMNMGWCVRIERHFLSDSMNPRYTHVNFSKVLNLTSSP